MKKIYHILLFLFLFINLTAQNKGMIEFINSNKVFVTKEYGPDIRFCVGEVAFQHDSATIYCDSAALNLKLNKVDLFGGVEIQKLYGYYDTIFLFGDTIHYDGDLKLAKVRKKVKLVQDTSVLTTNFLDFDLNTNVGKYFNGGRVISGQDTIISRVGYYYSNTKDVFLKGNVKVFSAKAKIFTDTLKHNMDSRISYILGPSEIYSDSTYIFGEFGRYDYNENRAYLSGRSKIESGEHIIEADSLFFDKKTGFGVGIGNVSIIDTIQNLILKGNYGEYFRDSQMSMMTDSAIFMEIDGTDTLWLHSDTLLSYIDTLFDYTDTVPFRMLFAYNHVKIYKKDLQLKTDSLVYSQLDSLLMLFGRPVIWSEKSQLNSEYAELYMSNNNPREMLMFDSAYIAEKFDTTKFNVVKSSFVHAWFRKKTVYKVQVTKNVNTLYYLQDDADSSIIGVGVLECDSMIIYIDSSKIDLLVPYKNPIGNLYPPDKVPTGKNSIPGFIWFEENRPRRKEDVFIWKEFFRIYLKRIEKYR